MIKSKADILAELEATDRKLDQSMPATQQRGAIESVIRLVVPMQKDQIRLMRMVVESMPD